MSVGSPPQPAVSDAAIAEWRLALEAALEEQGDFLEEIPRIGDPGTSEGREAVLRGWGAMAKAAIDRERANAAGQIVKCGLQDARSLLHRGENSLGVREYTLLFFLLAGFTEYQGGDHPAAAGHFRDGIDVAREVLAAGGSSPSLRDVVLALFLNGGNNEYQRGDHAAAAEYYQEGIATARTFIAAGESSPGVCERALSLFYNAGANEKHRGDHAAAMRHYEEGIATARLLLGTGELSPGAHEILLRLLTDAGVDEDRRGNYVAAAGHFLEGIAAARSFIETGEFSPGMGVEVTLLFINAGANQERLNNPYGTAEEYYREAIAYARQFLGYGDARTGVDVTILSLLVGVAGYENRQGNFVAASGYYQEGITNARDVLAAGEATLGIRRQTSWLFLGRWINELSLGMRAPVAWLEFLGAFWWFLQIPDRDVDLLEAASTFMQRGWEHLRDDQEFFDACIGFLKDFLLAWHGADDPHGNFGGALDGEGHERSPVETALAALEGLVLWEHAQANRRTRAHYERLNRLREAVSETCAAWRQEQDNRRAGLLTRRCRLYRLRAFCRRHGPLSAVLPVLDKRIRRNFHGLLRPRAESLWNCYSDLRQGLTGWVLDGLSDTLGLAAGLAEEADVLLAAATLTAGGGSDGLAALLGQWLSGAPPWRDADRHAPLLAPLADAWSEDGEALIDRWLEHLGQDATELEVDQHLRFGPAPTLVLAFAAHTGGDQQSLCRMLDGAWGRAYREAERLDRLHGALALGEGIDALCPPLAARDANPATADDEVSPVEALLDDILAWQGLATGLANEADVLLGALFVLCLREQPEATTDRILRQWRDVSSWDEPEDTEQTLRALQRAWFARTGNSDNDWMEFARLDAPTRQEPPPIRRWLEALHLTSDIEVDSALANAPAPTLGQAFSAAQRGDAGPLHALLDAGWQRAQRTARTLLRLRDGLQKGWINHTLADILEARSYRDACLSAPQRNLLYDITQSQERAALAAVLPGRAREFLRLAVEANVSQRAQQPAFLAALAACIRGRRRHYLQERIATTCDTRARIAPGQPLDRLGPAASRLYATAVHLHPGQAGDGALTSRLHQWARAALQEASAGDDLERIWSALEIGRIALSGLALPPPDRTWMTETAELLRKALAFSVNGDPDDPDWRRGWPPLTAWIRQCGKLRPASASLPACQSRLRPGEALVQPFFVPDSGELQTLWLSAGGELERRCFAPDCDEARWRETVFEPWSRWLDGVTRDPEARVWRKPGSHTLNEPPSTHYDEWDAILGRPPVGRFAETLACWAGEAGIARLIMFLPAPLAQLPWESLPESLLPSGLLVRAVSLSHWRRAPRPDTDPAGWTFYDADVDANGVRSLHFAGLEARRVDPAPYPNRARTSADVIAGLQGPATARAILHGLYRRFAPLRSGLAVHPGQFLPLWLPAAIGVKARLAVLSACESNLSGQATDGLLGPVGIGPAFVAAGAEAVLGTLWPCHDLATVALADRLKRVANDDRWSTRLLNEQVAEAARRLRGMTGGEVRALIERLAAESGEDFTVYDDERWQPFYRDERPFAAPKFWAPYVVLGELPPAAVESWAEI